MLGRSLSGLAILAWGLLAFDAVAQTKSSSKHEAAKRLKQEVNSLVSEADAEARKDPEKAYDRLRLALDQLSEPSPLSRDERLTLMAKVEKRMNDARRAMAKSSSSSSNGKMAWSQGPKEKKDNGQISPFFTNFSNVGVTPVVSGDRRFVRISLRGAIGFVAPTGPMIPIQIPVPTILYGPGVGATAGPPEKIFQRAFPAPRGTIIQFNSTVTVPSGGFASLGGHSSRMESRNEFGVPGAGKVPYLGRLFRNIGYGADLTTHSIGVSARVISMEEEEQRFIEQARGR